MAGEGAAASADSAAEARAAPGNTRGGPAPPRRRRRRASFANTLFDVGKPGWLRLPEALVLASANRLSANRLSANRLCANRLSPRLRTLASCHSATDPKQPPGAICPSCVQFHERLLELANPLHEPQSPHAEVRRAGRTASGTQAQAPPSARRRASAVGVGAQREAEDHRSAAPSRIVRAGGLRLAFAPGGACATPWDPRADS